jgi:hypothetical protein
VDTNARWLGIAAALAAAAYILTTRDVSAAEADQSAAAGNDVSGNGFSINNPLNIRYLAKNAFNGQTGNHNGYGVYDTLAHGVHAAFEQLSEYVARGLDTVTQIVSTWAPASENNDPAYISDVAQRMGVDANEPLAWPDDAVDLIQAMAWHENGYNPMASSDVQQYIA